MYRTDTALHPPIARPRECGLLDVGEGHAIGWEETGNSAGVPLLVLHGGPGGRIVPYYRRLPDPQQHRAIYFDQRGCGHSTPFGSLEHNDTWRLVADIEALRVARGIERWLVLGGSWGSALALSYAEAHQQAVAGLVLSGVFLARAEDSHWWWEGARQVFPDAYARRDLFLTDEERSDPRTAFQRRILNPDPAIHGPAAQVLMLAEFSTLELWPNLMLEDPDTIDPAVVAGGRIAMHYDSQQFFLDENQLLRDAARLRDIPCEIIAGRSDMCTPPKGAYDLAQALPGARLTIVPAAGHRWNDEMLCRDVVRALARATAASGL